MREGLDPIDDLISRADSLIKPDAAGERLESRLQMSRRRSFVASPTRADRRLAPARPTPPASDDDDLPVLTDIVLPATTEPGANLEPLVARLRATLADDLADMVARQLANDLPVLLEAALLNAAEPLRQSLEATLQLALRNFVAARGQLRLPLAERHDDEQSAADRTPED
ncbi:hypothetical protein [Accumulibacter sp.]|uniref:hypothetical protein n=1 Tax=Accumulibacter sp. TaxID=2053492 RepID=UPI00262DB979|nr:hypothetical protein [Accumulibacter sp.]